MSAASCAPTGTSDNLAVRANARSRQQIVESIAPMKSASSKHVYRIHGLLLSSRFEIGPWSAALEAKEQSGPDSVGLELVRARRRMLSTLGVRSTVLRRSGVAVDRGPHGLLLDSGRGDLAWLEALASEEPGQRRRMHLFRGQRSPRDQFERLIANSFVPNALAESGHVMLHAAAVVVEGHAALFCGASGEGKSTLAAGFARRGLRVLSDDVLRVASDQTGVWNTYPSYPSIHIRRGNFLQRWALEHAGAVRGRSKSWFGFDVQGDQSSSYPVACMYVLGRQRAAGPSFSRIEGVASLDGWIRALFMDAVAPDSRAVEALSRASRLSREIPTYQLRYRRSASRFEELLDAALEHVVSLR